jgi:adenylylsulfate kinase
VACKTKPAFAVWITGLPSSGKSTVAAALVKQLEALGVDAAVLESDELRKVFTPHPVYSEGEREKFYHAMAYVGTLLVDHGVPVIFDATANRRAYRDRARHQIGRFIEVYLDCPIAVCVQRDPKGLYRKAQAGATSTLPGIQASYEEPERPDVVVGGDRDAPPEAAQKIVSALIAKGYLSGTQPSPERE